MNSPATEKINIPAEDVGRQAVRSLSGYVYQLYQTLTVWLGLPQDELLLIEVAEDYATIAKNAVNQTQVKNTGASGTITLRSAAALKLIESHYRLQLSNPDKQVTSTLLTTADVGREAGLSFPNGQPGLVYWRTAARDGTDVGPVKDALLSSKLSEDVLEGIRSSSADEFRNQFLKPIKWVTAAESFDGVRQAVRDELVYLGDRHGFLSIESERAEDRLLGELLRIIVSDAQRIVTLADLYRIFHSAMTIAMPIPTVRRAYYKGFGSFREGDDGTLVSSSSPAIRSADQVPLAPRVAARSTTVADIYSKAREYGVLWLHGSSGLGKTTLALLTARDRDKSWLFVDLRNCAASEVGNRIAAAAHEVRKRQYAGLILDDYPVEESAATLIHLAAFVHIARLNDVVVLITSSRRPAPVIETRLGERELAVVDVPYLSEEDVAELVAASGGDPAIWAKPVYFTCGFGHPQLVDARILGLSRRNWDQAELMVHFDPTAGGAREILEQRDLIYTQLMTGLPDDVRELLYRLALISGQFDRRLAMAVGEAGTAVSRPGEAFSYLLGPWIELRGEDRYSVSPLISDSGSRNLSRAQQSYVRNAIVTDLIQRQPFPADLLMQLLAPALIEKHQTGLTWFSYAILHNSFGDKETFNTLAIHISLFAVLATSEGQVLFPENRHLSVMLRLSQFQIAAATGNSDNLAHIFDRLFAEIGELERSEGHSLLYTTAVGIALMCRHLRVRPRKWMTVLTEWQLVRSRSREADDLFKKVEVPEGLPKWDLDQFLFVNQATILANVDSLVELFEILDGMPASRRDYLIAALQDPYLGSRIVIQGSWLNESKNSDLDGKEAAEKFRLLADIGRRWRNADIEIECECARAVMLDEYGRDANAALAVLDSAIAKYPSDYRLLRRKQNVLIGLGDHEGALKVVSSIVNTFPTGESIERAFALRDAGRSAALAGDLERAAFFFSEAAISAQKVGESMYPMAVGLLGDCAVVEFEWGDLEKAVKLAISALEQADGIDPEAGPREKYTFLILGHLVLWMRQELEEPRKGELEFVMSPGGCSNPNPSAEIMDRETPPRILPWYLIALLEIEQGINVGAFEALIARRGDERYVGYELLLTQTIIERGIGSSDAERVLAELPNYLGVQQVLADLGESFRNRGSLNELRAVITPVRDSDWGKNKHLGFVEEAIVGFCLYAVVNARFTSFDQMVAKLRKMNCPELDELLVRLTGQGTTERLTRRSEVGANCVAICRQAGSEIDPERAFYLTCFLWDWIRMSPFKKPIENSVVKFVADVWRYVTARQRFLLRNPQECVLVIEAIVASNEMGLKKLASLVLAAERAVKNRLSDGFRSDLKRYLSA